MASGFSFGAKTTPAPAFGTPTLSLGNSTNQPQPVNLSFGTAAPPFGTTTLSLGSTTNQPQSVNLGFGAHSVPASTPAMFSATVTGPAPTSTPSLFGTNSAAAGLFPAPTTSAVPTLSFGAPATTTSGGLFGAPATTTAPPSFGASLGQPALPSTGFGASTASTSTPSLGFGLTTSAPTGSLKLGSTPSSTAPSLNFGLGGLGAASVASAPLATTSVSVGLGGLATSIQGKGAVATQKEVAPKEQTLPNEILQTVEAFKEMVKQQKSNSSDISRCSVRDFRRVEQEIDQLSQQLNEVENQLQRNRQVAEKLKYDTAKTVQHVEMAQRTHDTPAGLQYENTAPMKFFLNLAGEFENNMQSLKLQIESMEKYVKNHKDPYSLTPQDLSMGMKRLHETFVALAGRLQAVHSQVETQKELYWNIRKQLLQDSSNPFAKLEKAPVVHVSNLNAFAHSPPKVASGPTPFNTMAVINVSAAAPQQPSGQPPPYPGSFSSQPGTGFGSAGFAAPGGTQTSNTSLFGSASFNQSFNNTFQLQKPPTGTKRGKV